MESSVKNAQKMVIDMLKSTSQTKLSETSGINQVTLASLKNGKASRISEKVWSRLVKAYDGDTAPVPVKHRLQRKEPVIAVERKGISPQPEPPKLIETIDGIVTQLENLRKQIKPLEELRTLLMKMN
jgi:DNA-binding Xre family transcriptional regulator